MPRKKALLINPLFGALFNNQGVHKLAKGQQSNEIVASDLPSLGLGCSKVCTRSARLLGSSLLWLCIATGRFYKFSLPLKGKLFHLLRCSYVFLYFPIFSYTVDDRNNSPLIGPLKRSIWGIQRFVPEFSHKMVGSIWQAFGFFPGSWRVYGAPGGW